jgi:aryl-alcohol dehydrogenase-like predicted oxidoreductase
MRYRPFALTGMAVSALSLGLDGADSKRTAAEWRDLTHGAFEEGINAFELIRPNRQMLEGFAEGAAAVRRQLVFVSLRVDAQTDPTRLPAWVDAIIGATGLGDFNLLTVEVADPPGPEPVATNLLAAMRRLKDLGRAHRLAIAGAGDVMLEPVRSGAFDALVTPFNLLSGWRERNLIRTALERQMGVIGLDACPPAVAELTKGARAESKPGWFKRANPLAGVGTYGFLTSTQGWSAEQLCLGYAFTEPALATVQMIVEDREHLTDLAGVAERDLPAAVSAQIEMARFSAERAAGADDRGNRRSA